MFKSFPGFVLAILVSFACFFIARFHLTSFIFSLSVQLGPKFMRENGIKHVTFSTADGALEAAPAVR